MTEELSPTVPQIDAYFGTLNTRLNDVPELRPGLDLAATNPELAATIYTGYVALISHMPELTTNARETIRIAKDKLICRGGNFGTASQTSADDLLNELGDNPGVLQDLAQHSADQTSPYFVPAMDELTRRMEGGHRLKISGKQPSDDDPESRTVIWGHTMITDPNALVHFMVCHYMERYFAAALVEQGSHMATQKDFLLNALIDVVLVDHISDGKFAAIYDVWSAPKDEGGLGWITQNRQHTYENAA